MSLLIKPKIVINNAFAAKQASVLSNSMLRKFCDMLHDRLMENGYKYVVFQVSDEDIDEFCEKDGQFIKGIKKSFPHIRSKCQKWKRSIPYMTLKYRTY